MLDEKNNQEEKITGYQNEFEFVKYLNNKMVKELNPLFSDLIEELFPNVQANDVIKCWRNHFKQKSDIFIKINTTIKGISIKKGIKNSVHVEPISEFIHFLIENKVNNEIINKYLYFHYADGSTNGKGNIRISSEEYKLSHQNEIDEINSIINSTNLLYKVADRFILRVTNSEYSISALIYGTVDDFIWIKRDDIKKLIVSKSSQYSSAVHFGPLTCQPKDRCLNYNPKYEKK